MNLEDLMTVWRSQDAAPLHGINETLLRLALRQEEADLKKQRNRERWITYLTTAGFIAGAAVFIGLMLFFQQHRSAKTVTAWDFIIPLIAAAAAAFSAYALYRTQRTHTRREQRFGESLRDQVNRRITQLDGQATDARRTNVLIGVLMGGVCPTAILIAMWRLNEKAISDDGFLLLGLIALVLWSVVSSTRQLRHRVRKELLPRKRELESLLTELDSEQ